jgi:hypothetical protein
MKVVIFFIFLTCYITADELQFTKELILNHYQFLQVPNHETLINCLQKEEEISNHRLPKSVLINFVQTMAGTKIMKGMVGRISVALLEADPQNLLSATEFSFHYDQLRNNVEECSSTIRVTWEELQNYVTKEISYISSIYEQQDGAQEEEQIFTEGVKLPSKSRFHE